VGLDARPAQPRGGALPARPRSPSRELGLVARPCVATVLRASLTTFGRRRLRKPSRWRNDRPGPAPESCPRHDPGSTALAPRRQLQPDLGRPDSVPDSPRPPGGLDRPARGRPGVASFREVRPPVLVPDRDRGLNSYRVSLRRPPAAADRGAGSGIAARLAISRGMSRLLSGSPRGF
jgi:hypothetical protein